MINRFVFPIEVVEKIAKHLALHDVKKLMGISKKIKKAVEANPLVWKHYVESQEAKCINGRYLPVVRAEHKQTAAWVRRRVKGEKTVKHIAYMAAVTKMKVFGDILVVSSNSDTVKVFDTSMNLLSTLKGHKGSVWAFDYSNSILVTGGTDRVAKVWDCVLGVCLKTLTGHASTIRCVRITEKHVLTGSRDSTIRVWCKKTGMCKHVLFGHRSSIRALLTVKDTPFCVSGSYDGSAVLWNYHTGEAVRCLFKGGTRIYALCTVDGHIGIAGMDKVLYVVSLKGQLVFKSKDHTGTIFKMKSDAHGCVYTLTTTGTLSKWDVRAQSLVYMIEFPGRAVEFDLLNHLIVLCKGTEIALHCKASGAYLGVSASAEHFYSMCVTETGLFYAFRNRLPTFLKGILFERE